MRTHIFQHAVYYPLCLILFISLHIPAALGAATGKADKLMMLAQKASNAGDYSGSSRIYNMAMTAGADSLPCLQALADNAMKMHDYVAVVEICPQLRQLGGEMPYTYNYEAQANAAMGNLDLAADKVITLVEMVGIDNDSYEAMTTVAERDLPVMVKTFESEKNSDPRNPLWCECLGTIYANARLYTQAVSAFLDALKLNPDSDTDMETLALLYNQMRDYANALHYATQAITTNPSSVDYVCNKAIIERNAGNLSAGVNTLTNAMSDTMTCVAYLIERGMLYASQGKYKEALNDYDEAIQTDPSSAVAYLRKGILLFKLGERQKADEMFRKVVDSGDTHWSGTALANAYLGNKTAVDKYIDYATTVKNKISNYFSLAAISDVNGEPEKALQYIELALKENTLNPDVIQYDLSLDNVKKLSGFKTLMSAY